VNVVVGTTGGHALARLRPGEHHAHNTRIGADAPDEGVERRVSILICGKGLDEVI
jgi:hypothetical protein